MACRHSVIVCLFMRAGDDKFIVFVKVEQTVSAQQGE